MAKSNSSKKMLGKYSLIRVVGKGGMGEVYLAMHPTLKREIILKKLTIRNKEARERFLQEAHTMLEFRHENIVQLYDHFKEGPATYIAMEYVKGKALNDIIRENEMLPVPLALFILYQSALGLHHAHVKKVIHRDIKPHNILISVGGNVKLTDFGISKKSDNSEEITRPGTIVGTPAYMAPEQFKGDTEASYQSDIYSLGIVFYEMITGVRPYKNEYSPDVVSAIAKGKHSPAGKYIKKMPSIAKKILNKTFNPKKSKRYKNLVPLIKMLRKYFKKYNVFEIKDSIRRLLLKDKNIVKSPFFQSVQRINKRNMIAKIIIASILLVSLITFLFIKTNRYYEWFQPGKYGRVVLEFKRADLDPGNISFGVNDNYKKALFLKHHMFYINLLKPKKNKAKYKNVANYYLPLIDITIVRHNKKNYKKKIIYKYDLPIRFKKILYLEKGEHELSVVSGAYKNTKTVIIVPRAVQKQNRRTSGGQRVYIPIANLWSQEVTVFFRFWDFFNQDNLLLQFDHHTDKKLRDYEKETENLLIYNRKEYRLLKDYVLYKKDRKEAPFMSGGKYGYSFFVKDYKRGSIEYNDLKFNVKFKEDERTVVVHETLVPKPCKIKIESDKKRYHIFINGEKEGLVYVKGNYVYKKYNSIDIIKKKDKYYREIELPPGKIVFKFTKNKEGKKITKNLYSNKEFEIKLRNENGKLIY